MEDVALVEGSLLQHIDAYGRIGFDNKNVEKAWAWEKVAASHPVEFKRRMAAAIRGRRFDQIPNLYKGVFLTAEGGDLDDENRLKQLSDTLSKTLRFNQQADPFYSRVAAPTPRIKKPKLPTPSSAVPTIRERSLSREKLAAAAAAALYGDFTKPPDALPKASSASDPTPKPGPGPKLVPSPAPTVLPDPGPESGPVPAPRALSVPVPAPTALSGTGPESGPVPAPRALSVPVPAPTALSGSGPTAPLAPAPTQPPAVAPDSSSADLYDYTRSSRALVPGATGSNRPSTFSDYTKNIGGILLSRLAGSRAPALLEFLQFSASEPQKLLVVMLATTNPMYAPVAIPEGISTGAQALALTSSNIPTINYNNVDGVFNGGDNVAVWDEAQLLQNPIEWWKSQPQSTAIVETPGPFIETEFARTASLVSFFATFPTVMVNNIPTFTPFDITISQAKGLSLLLQNALRYDAVPAFIEDCVKIVLYSQQSVLQIEGTTQNEVIYSALEKLRDIENVLGFERLEQEAKPLGLESRVQALRTYTNTSVDVGQQPTDAMVPVYALAVTNYIQEQPPEQQDFFKKFHGLAVFNVSQFLPVNTREFAENVYSLVTGGQELADNEIRKAAYQHGSELIAESNETLEESDKDLFVAITGNKSGLVTPSETIIAQNIPKIKSLLQSNNTAVAIRTNAIKVTPQNLAVQSSKLAASITQDPEAAFQIHRFFLKYFTAKFDQGRGEEYLRVWQKGGKYNPDNVNVVFPVISDARSNGAVSILLTSLLAAANRLFLPGAAPVPVLAP